MRYRRRVVRRTAPRRIWRRRRFVRRRKIFRRARPGRGCFRFKFTRVTTVKHTLQNAHIWSSQFSPQDIPEFVELAPNFESYRFRKVAVRVVPSQNVMNNTTSRMSIYCMFPWKRPIPASSNSFTSFLSVDRAKVFRDTQLGRGIYNVCALQGLKYDGPSPGLSEKVAWSPRIEIKNGQAATLNHYAACVAWKEVADAPADATAYYDIVIDYYCDMYNQDIIKE